MVEQRRSLSNPGVAVYVDRLRVAIELTEHLAYYPREVWTLELGGEVSGEDVREDLSRMLTLDGRRDLPLPNGMTVEERRTNWGASAAVAEYVLAVSSGMAGSLGRDIVIASVRSIFTSIRKRARDEGPSSQLGHEAAAELLRKHIAQHYDEPAESLKESASSLDAVSGVQEISFVAESGRLYGGTVGEVDGSPRCTRVWFDSEEPRERRR